jgi:hypothetical protein
MACGVEVRYIPDGVWGGGEVSPQWCGVVWSTACSSSVQCGVVWSTACSSRVEQGVEQGVSMGYCYVAEGSRWGVAGSDGVSDGVSDGGEVRIGSGIGVWSDGVG